VGIDELKEFLKEFFKNDDVKVYLFGSRARGDFRRYSDIDLAVESNEDIRDKIIELKDILEESNLIYKVDIVDLKKAPYLDKKEMIRWV